MVKVFQGAGYDEYLRSIRKAFGKVVVRKPRHREAKAPSNTSSPAASSPSEIMPLTSQCSDLSSPRDFSQKDSLVNNTIRTIMVWLVIGVILTMVFMQVGNRQSSQNTLDYSTFMEEARQGHITKAKLDNNRPSRRPRATARPTR